MRNSQVSICSALDRESYARRHHRFGFVKFHVLRLICVVSVVGRIFPACTFPLPVHGHHFLPSFLSDPFRTTGPYIIYFIMHIVQ